jgi:hypothetical protein
MSFRRPREVNMHFGVRQQGQGHEPISLIVAIKTLRVIERCNLPIFEDRTYFSG